MVLDKQNDWTLPVMKPLFLETGELLLLDWIMCTASNLILGADLDTLVHKYDDLRLKVWQAISTAKVMPAEIYLNMDELEEFMALVPTTFRWGTGPDVGYTLKLKIAQGLMGVSK